MSTPEATNMEVDPPGIPNDCLNKDEEEAAPTLKRSNSAPMLATTASSQPTTQQSPVTTSCTSHSSSFLSNSLSSAPDRLRRYSVSSFNVKASSPTPLKIPGPRLHQIKHEDRITGNIKELEAAQEKDIHSAIQLSQSWEELSLTEQEPMSVDGLRRPRSFQEPLHVTTPPSMGHHPYSSSPSPTRIGKQCFSPSLGYPVRVVGGVGGALSPSPSPTRSKFSRRSHSPIIFQPSRLGASLKRKIDIERDAGADNYFSPSKRMTLSESPANSSTMHPLMHSISNSSLSDTSCPDTGEATSHSQPLLTSQQPVPAPAPVVAAGAVGGALSPASSSPLYSTPLIMPMRARRRNTPSPLCMQSSPGVVSSMTGSSGAGGGGGGGGHSHWFRTISSESSPASSSMSESLALDSDVTGCSRSFTLNSSTSAPGGGGGGGSSFMRKASSLAAADSSSLTSSSFTTAANSSSMAAAAAVSELQPVSISAAVITCQSPQLLSSSSAAAAAAPQSTSSTAASDVVMTPADGRERTVTSSSHNNVAVNGRHTQHTSHCRDGDYARQPSADSTT